MNDVIWIVLKNSGLFKKIGFRFFIAWVFVIGCAHVGLREAYDYDAFAQKTYGPSIQIDGDTVDFAAEIRSAPHPGDVMKWWHGPWMQKVPYFRPLTMTAFWSEYRIFGENGRVAFQWAHRLWHLAFLTLLLVFLSKIAGIERATVGTAMFALGWNKWFNYPTGTDAFNCWKDQCDIWSIMATTAACLSLWLWLNSRPDEATKRWWKQAGWWRTFAFFVLGLTIKETGSLAPLYLTLTLWMAGRLRRNWLCLWPFYGGSLVWCGLRYMALGGWGHRTGDGGGWPTRFKGQVLGLPTPVIAGDGLTIFALGMVVGLVLLWKWRHDMKNRVWHRALGGWLIAMLLSLWMGLRYLPETSVYENLARLTIPYNWLDVALLGITSTGFALMGWQLKRGEKVIAFGWLWVLIGFLPFILQPPTSSHVHYPIAPGWSLWLAGCGFALFELAQTKLRARIG